MSKNYTPQILNTQEQLTFFDLACQEEGSEFERLIRAAEVLARALALKWGVPLTPAAEMVDRSDEAVEPRLEAARQLFAKAQDPATDFTAPQRFQGAIGHPAPLDYVEGWSTTVGTPAKSCSPGSDWVPTPLPVNGTSAGSADECSVPDLPFGTLQVRAKHIVFGGGTTSYPKALVLRAQRLANALEALERPAPVHVQITARASCGARSTQ